MEAGQFQIRMTADFVLGEGSPPSLKTATFSLCPNMTEPLTPSQGPTLIKGFPDFSVVKKHLPAKKEMQEVRVQSLDQEDPLERTLSSIPA